MEIHPFGSTAAGHVNVMIDPLDVDGVVRDEPEACAPLFWGKDVRGVRIDLDRAPRELVANLLHVAWSRKAPRRLLDRTAGERVRPGRDA